MNSTERKYFDKLIEIRKVQGQVFQSPFMREVVDTITQRERDPMHFIYELLQNADDAGATQVRFIMMRDQLVFIHNGKRRLTISDPECETEDLQNGKLGDLNALTSFGVSNKDASSTGFAGLGFKSVFRYSPSPHFYDSNFRFALENFIVPVELEYDYPGRKEEETVIVLPFENGCTPECDNNPSNTAACPPGSVGGNQFDGVRRPQYPVTFGIANTLGNLSDAIVFLRNISFIEYQTSSGCGSYTFRTVAEAELPNGISLRQVEITRSSPYQLMSENLYLVGRTNQQGKYEGTLFTFDPMMRMTGNIHSHNNDLDTVLPPHLYSNPTMTVGLSVDDDDIDIMT